MYLSCAKKTWVSKQAKSKAAVLSEESVKNICVIKHGALGDMVLIRPMLLELRKAFPNAKITLAVIEHYMRGIPYDLIDDVHITKSKESSKKEQLNNLKAIKKQDILFDITETTRSMWLALFTKATLKIGFMHKGLHRLVYDIAIPRAHYRFEAETFSEQLNALGIDFEWPLKFDLSVPEKKINKPYMVYFPTASNLEKSWPSDNFIDLIKHSSEKHKDYLHVILSGIADWEIDIADNIFEKTKVENVQLFYGGDDTESIIANADILISNDTGIRNLAIAFYTPTVGIFPPNNYAVAFGYKPFFGTHKIINPTDNKTAATESVIVALDDVITEIIKP